MDTREQLNADFELLSKTAMRVKVERDALLLACKLAYAELDARYDVDQEGEHMREIPFSGAGDLMRRLKGAIDKAEGAP